MAGIALYQVTQTVTVSTELTVTTPGDIILNGYSFDENTGTQGVSYLSAADGSAWTFSIPYGHTVVCTINCATIIP